MVYMGSKNRISKDILKKIEPYLSKDKMYYEPFVGGANMIDKIPKDKVKGLVGNDFNEYIIALLSHMEKGREIPYKFIERDDWFNNYVYPFRKGELKLPKWEIGYMGITKTFSGKFMQSYGGMSKPDERMKDPKPRNYQLTRHNNIIKQAPNLKGIKFIHGDYKDMEIENGSVVYIDPPYRGTTKYIKGIDHNELYEWIHNLVDNKGCTVFISEYEMPPEFTCIWQKELKNGIGTHKDKKSTEKLFILKK